MQGVGANCARSNARHAMGIWISALCWLLPAVPATPSQALGDHKPHVLGEGLPIGTKQAVAFGAHPSRLACGMSTGDGGIVALWDPTTAKLTKVLRGASGPITSVAFSPNGGLLAASGAAKMFVAERVQRPIPGEVWVWDTATGKLQRTLTGHKDWVRAVRFSPRGDLLASASWDKTVRMWDTKTWELMRTFSHPDEVSSIAFSPTGEILASGCGSGSVLPGGAWRPKPGEIKIWHVGRWLPEGELVRTLRGHADDVIGLAFSPDGKTLASASAAGGAPVRIWDTSSWEPITELRTDRPLSLAFSPKGELLAIAGGDALDLWDTQTWQVKASLPAWGVSVSFSEDGKLLGACDRAVVKLWDVSTESE